MNEICYMKYILIITQMQFFHQTYDMFIYITDQWFFGQENVVWQTQDFNGADLIIANHPSVLSMHHFSFYRFKNERK